jgi:hypothetical protein
MSFAASSLGDDVLTNEQSKLDADAGKPDALSANFIARCNVMKARQRRRCIPDPLSITVSARSAGSQPNEIVEAPESRALAMISVRIVSSTAPG